MNRMGLRTLSIYSVLLISFFKPFHSLEYSNTNCLKFQSSDIVYECPKQDAEITVQITPKNRVVLQCLENTSPFLDIDILPELDLKGSISFNLEHCYLNVSFYDVLKKFNMKKIKNLAFRSSTRENDEKIINVTRDLFEHMESIESLALEFSTLNLSVNFLENTPNLRKLSLKKTGLRQILKYFDHVPRLEILDLSGNQIEFLPDGVFDNLENLIQLHAWDNNFTGITKNMFKELRSLQLLELSGNHIGNIEEDSFSNMPKLTSLSFHYNNIQEAHGGMFKNNKLLKNIRFGYNPNMMLSDYVFANLTSLQSIDLSFNNLQDIPEHIFLNCGKLRDLILKGNRLSTIPEVFRDLTSLKKLDVSNNLLETLSYQSFSSVDNLEELYISNNRLTALGSDVFLGMKKLEILNLGRNNIGFIHPTAFRGLDSLIRLDLSYNQWNNTYSISDMPPFGDFPNLKELVLRNNIISDYPSIQDLNKLEKIDLSFNLIKDLEVGDFTQSDQLTLEVDLTHNEIQTVDFQLAKLFAEYNPILYNSSYYVGTSKIINLDYNPIVCDCSNIDLVRYNNDEMEDIRTMVDIKQDKLTCINNKNILVRDLKPEQIDCPVLKGCPSPCTCTYKPYNSAVIVDCSFNNLTSYPDFYISETKYEQTILNLKGNHLTAGPVKNFNYENITYLDLSQNHISEMSWIPPNIKELNLNENYLHNLYSHFVDLLKNRTSLERIHLESNLWDCNCDALDLQKFLIENHHKVNISDVYCHEIRDQLVKLTDLCEKPMILTVLLPIFLTILLCFMALLAIYYRYQRYIKIYLYAKNLCLWFVTEEELDKDMTYDVFISYANQDEEFVTGHLLPELELGKAPLKVCVHTRDWVPGEFKIEQIINSVKNSKRTLIVLSNNFVESMWGKLEFRTAHTEACDIWRFE